MKVRLPHSLHWRIALAYTALIFLSLGVVSLYLVNFVRDTYISNLHDSLDRQARLVSYMASDILSERRARRHRVANSNIKSWSGFRRSHYRYKCRRQSNRRQRATTIAVSITSRSGRVTAACSRRICRVALALGRHWTAASTMRCSMPWRPC